MQLAQRRVAHTTLPLSMLGAVFFLFSLRLGLALLSESFLDDFLAEVLAVLVVANKFGETEEIKLVFGFSRSNSNKTYHDARTALKAVRNGSASVCPIKDGKRQPFSRTA